MPPRAIARRGVGRTFQVAATFASMTVRENVQLALLANAAAHRSIAARATDCLRTEADALLERVRMTKFSAATQRASFGRAQGYFFPLRL